MNETNPKFHEVAQRVLELKDLNVEVFSTFRQYEREFHSVIYPNEFLLVLPVTSHPVVIAIF